MKRAFLYISAIISLSTVLVSCEKEDPIGPNLEDLYGAFRILDSLSAPTTIDFTADDSVTFNGSWSNMANWKLTITGKTSGAVKTIEGKSKSLDTAIAAWNGTADGIFFKKENCDVELTFKDYPDTMKTTTTLNQLHDYSNDGIILQTFEGSGTIEFWGGNGNQGKKSNKSDSPQGSNYYYMEGTEPANAYWIGSFPPFNATTLTGAAHFPFIDSESETTYVNFFVRGYGYPATFVNIQAKIDDNNDGIYAETEGSFSNRYPITGTTWQKISIPLNTLVSDANSSLSLSEISKITTFYVMLFSDGIANPKLGCDIDFIILTQGKPL